MKKLELKHFKNYFDYDLNILITSADGEEILPLTGMYKKDGTEIVQISNTDYYLDSDENEFKIQPILRPITDLIKEIEHNGKIIIPIIDLFNLKTQHTSDKLERYYIENDTAILQLQESINPDRISSSIDFFEIDLEAGSVAFSLVTEFYLEGEKVDDRFFLLGNEQKMYEYLRELLFDTDGLIATGLAIDINTLYDVTHSETKENT
jgi:hypothetical protein